MKSLFLRDFLILFSAGVTFFVIDVATAKDSYKECENPKAHSVLLFHHLFSIFMYFGWISNQPGVLTIVAACSLGVLAHWNCNQDLCGVTQYHNKLCKLPKETKFRSMFALIGFGESMNKKSTSSLNAQRGFLYAVFLICVYKLCRAYHKHSLLRKTVVDSEINMM